MTDKLKEFAILIRDLDKILLRSKDFPAVHRKLQEVIALANRKYSYMAMEPYYELRGSYVDDDVLARTKKSAPKK